MKVLLIGTGGREHALAWKLSLSNKVEKIYSTSNNPGIENEDKCELVNLKNIDEYIKFAKENKVDLTVVGPENPLMDGIGDKFREENLLIFAPNKNEANLEGFKDFAKKFMKKYNVSHSHSESFSNYEKALEYLENTTYPTVLKADGLCAGKGVIICNTKEEAKASLKEMMMDKIFKDAASSVVIEDYMIGKEISILSIYDGNNIFPMISSMDHKKIGEGETGLNTGGMGTIAPSPYFTKEVEKDFYENILTPTLNGLKREGFNTPACIFFGLMNTKDGIKCMEYNMRFGDPETQSVLSLLESDLFEIFYNACLGKLKKEDLTFKNEVALTVVGAAKGYPKDYIKDIELNFIKNDTLKVFIAGARKNDTVLLSNGGRVFNITTTSNCKDKCQRKIYEYLEMLNLKDIYYRKDIGNV